MGGGGDDLCLLTRPSCFSALFCFACVRCVGGSGGGGGVVLMMVVVMAVMVSVLLVVMGVV